MAQMMADTVPVPPEIRGIAVPEEAAAWERLGFAVGEDGCFQVGGVRVACGSERLEAAVAGLRAEHPDGLALHSSPHPPAPERHAHPNGAVAVDHVVALTDSLPRTLAALEAAGMEVRRIREPMAFLRMGECILEVVERGEGPPALWGLVVVVESLDTLGELVGTPRDAVQPGRRIATVRSEAGLSTALAFMTPRPQPSCPR